MKSEAEKAINKMKGGKAAGPPSITIEIINTLKEFRVDKITDTCIYINEIENLTQDMKHSEFITLKREIKSHRLLRF